jgi:NAD(P)-dependent dehydrogenase (short-subunit alcohol dehydrogenase family)
MAADSTALVTGGAIRLGKAIALDLARAGYNIALHYHSSEEQALATQAEIRDCGVACERFPWDLTDTGGLDGLVSRVKEAMPGLDTLVNSASGYVQADIANTREADFDQLFAVNLKAPYFLTQAFARHAGRGNVVNIVDNKIGFHQFKYAAYLLTKKGLADFTRMAALEFAPDIRVNGVAPGVTLPAGSRSDEYIAWRVQAIPLQRKGETDHITNAVLHLLENDFINGQVLVVDGGENIAGTGRNAGEFDPTKV